MSQRLISHNHDLKRLRDEGYDIEIRSGHLLMKQVPYVNSKKEISCGMLVSELSLAGDVTTAPGTHVAHFAGEYPCRRDGSAIDQIRNQSAKTRLAQDLEMDHSFSSKPTRGHYTDYYEKMTTYAAIISSPAQSLDPGVTPKTFPVIESTADESVFNYIDTASSRAGIALAMARLETGK